MEFSSPDIIKRGGQVHVSYGDDNGLFVVFDNEAVPDKERSVSEGRPCFKNREVVTIHIAGGDTVHRPVKYNSTAIEPSDMERFPKQWQAFKNKEVQVKDGTPIEEWAPISKSLAMELKAMNIFTVEDLVTLPDGKLNWMGSRELQKKAKLFIDSAKDAAPLLQVQEENAKLKRDMEALQQQFAAMSADKAKKPAKGNKDEDTSPVSAANGK
jgi:hypothetical protein